VVDLGDFAVTAPPGDGWEVNVAAQGMGVTFTRPRLGVGLFFRGRLPGATVITVLQNTFTGDAPLLSEEAEANRYRDHEEQGMVEQGVKAGLYRLSDVERDTVTLDGRRFYVLRYKQAIPQGFLRPDLVAESLLCVHYPADFQGRRVFYVFHISDSREGGSMATNDTSQIEPVLKSFRLKR